MSDSSPVSLEVGAKGFEGVGRVKHLRLSVHLDLGKRLEQGDHCAFGLLMALGGGGLERGADLCVAIVVWLSALASVVAARTEGVVMKRSGDLSMLE
jgi:hypothetical protein